jgi:acyl-CoA reductase-like NAD-dependent aldehyde dehydrogenase
MRLTQQQLEAHLWGAANILRGKTAAGQDYKNYILGVAAEVIEAQLAHAAGNALGRAYNRTTFAEQRRELMVKWADYLDRLRDSAYAIPLSTA